MPQAGGTRISSSAHQKALKPFDSLAGLNIPESNFKIPVLPSALLLHKLNPYTSHLQSDWDFGADNVTKKYFRFATG